MQVMQVTFYDEDGSLTVGELVNASTVLRKEEKNIHTQIDRPIHADRVVVATTYDDLPGEVYLHDVALGDVRYILPMVLA